MASSYASQFAGDTYFGQSGTNIPSFGVQGGYTGGSSTDVPPYFGSYVANAPAPGMGGSPGQPFSRELIDKLSLPVTQPPKDFLNNFLNKQQQQPSSNLQAATPSFDLNTPYIPGQQDYTGIPNATPEMLRRLQQRKMINPGGQELPGFLKPA